MEMSQLLKIYVFTSSELVLSTAAMHHSWHRISCNAKHLKKSLPDQCWEPISAFRNASKTAPAAMHHSWHRISCIAKHLKKSLPDQCWETDFCISKCKRNSTLNPFQYWKSCCSQRLWCTFAIFANKRKKKLKSLTYSSRPEREKPIQAHPAREAAKTIENIHHVQLPCGRLCTSNAI